jgi:hypothetical protein
MNASLSEQALDICVPYQQDLIESRRCSISSINPLATIRYKKDNGRVYRDNLRALYCNGVDGEMYAEFDDSVNYEASVLVNGKDAMNGFIFTEDERLICDIIITQDTTLCTFIDVIALIVPNSDYALRINVEDWLDLRSDDEAFKNTEICRIDTSQDETCIEDLNSTDCRDEESKEVKAKIVPNLFMNFEDSDQLELVFIGHMATCCNQRGSDSNMRRLRADDLNTNFDLPPRFSARLHGTYHKTCDGCNDDEWHWHDSDGHSHENFLLQCLALLIVLAILYKCFCQRPRVVYQQRCMTASSFDNDFRGTTPSVHFVRTTHSFVPAQAKAH